MLSLAVTNEIISTMLEVKGFGCRVCEAEVVFTTGGLSDPKSVGIVPDAGLLEFKTEGGVP